MFSVIIPVFNHERYLRQAVLSAVTCPLVEEVLLLDDGSIDGSHRLIQELSNGSLPCVRDLTPQPRINRGAHVCLNALAEAATSEWIAVLNSDDIFVAGRFETIERWLRMRPADFVFGDLSVLDQMSRQLGIKNGPFHPQYPFPANISVERLAAGSNWAELLANQNFIATTSNIVFRKSLFQSIGGFSNYRYIHDWDFALRASLSGRALYIPHPLTCYRVHPSNTIKESADRVDAEVGEMFHSIQRDFPHLATNQLFQRSLAGNEYIHPPKRTALRLETGDRDLYAKSLDNKVETNGPAGEFTYSPATAITALAPVHLQNALLSLAFQDLDFVFVSHTLEEPPLVSAHSFQDAIVFRERARDVILQGRTRELRGHIARLLPGEMAIEQLQLPFPANWQAPSLDQPRDDGIVHTSTGRPVIFILPALFAVGGVERLMVEMMRQLRHKYDFVVITVERLGKGHGSLHGQAAGVMLACYDLAELAPQSLFLPMMRRLNTIYRPALVWIPNGSPWQCDHARGIREVFTNIPIVDQQAYDTEAGWIARYHEPGIQSYDRFVAINTKIRDVQIQRYGIAPEKIDLIYHSINVDALGPIQRTTAQKIGYRNKYRLPAEGRLFGWVGRLTKQKRPLEFLSFIAAHPEEHFIMIGNGELAGDCDRYIADRNLRNVTAIRFCNTMGELFALMSGLLSASAYEGLPISMLEAIAMGVPVYSTDVGDVALILDEYQCGAVTSVDWDLRRYSDGFEHWRTRLPYRAPEAASKIRDRFAGPSVAALYDACFQRALGA